MPTIADLKQQKIVVDNKIIDWRDSLYSAVTNKDISVPTDATTMEIIDKVRDMEIVVIKEEVKFRLFHCDTQSEKIYELNPDTLEAIKSVSSPSVYPRGIGGG